MSKKINVAVLFGGRSVEHEISLLSAQNVIKALDPDKYKTVLIGIDKEGCWYYQEDSLQLLNSADPKKIALGGKSVEVLFSQNTDEHFIQPVTSNKPVAHIDVIFPVLHGTYGEDGSIQGLARLANIPCVGSGIIGSAVGMDKEVMKRLLRDAGVPIADFITVRNVDRDQFSYEKVSDILGNELFIKPANLGSSVGISQVREAAEFDQALDMALEFDRKVIIEEKIVGREIECAVLGNDSPEASVPGEVIPPDDFYSYEAKYIDEDGAKLKIPAELNHNQIVRIQNLAKRTFTILECRGMARVDMFLTADERLVINEINTLPGFTNISMYPSLWSASGISNSELVDKLISLAIEEHEMTNKLKFNF